MLLIPAFRKLVSKAGEVDKDDDVILVLEGTCPGDDLLEIVAEVFDGQVLAVQGSCFQAQTAVVVGGKPAELRELIVEHRIVGDFVADHIPQQMFQGITGMRVLGLAPRQRQADILGQMGQQGGGCDVDLLQFLREDQAVGEDPVFEQIHAQFPGAGQIFGKEKGVAVISGLTVERVQLAGRQILKIEIGVRQMCQLRPFFDD